MTQLLHTFEEITQDVFKIRDTFKRTLREKRKLEGEVLSLLHNFQVSERDGAKNHLKCVRYTVTMLDFTEPWYLVLL